MTVGLRTYNQYGTIQIDPSYSNYAFDRKAQCSVDEAPQAPWENGDPPPGINGRSLIVSNETWVDPYLGWAWGEWIIFQPSYEVVAPLVSDVGLRVRNESTGQVAYDSNHNNLRVIDFLNITANTSRTYPAGRTYRVAPIAWGGYEEIIDRGDAGMGDGSRFYMTYWSLIDYVITNNVIKFTRRRYRDPLGHWDGPPGMKGTWGSDPSLRCLVVDVTGL